jgi:hypothetical protein
MALGWALLRAGRFDVAIAETGQALSLSPLDSLSDFLYRHSRPRPSGRTALRGEFETCSSRPMTGFFRTGCCETGPEDVGAHVVCAEVTKEFLAFRRHEVTI